MKPKIKPNEFNDLVKGLRRVIETYKDTQQLRAHLVKVLNQHLEVLH